MFLRAASGVAVLLIGLVIDLGVPSGQPLAQNYPPPPTQPYPPQSYPPQSYPAPNRPPLPMQADPDDDLDALGPPRTFGFPGSRPPQPGMQYGGRAVYPQDADPYAPPPPGYAYPNGTPPPAYGAPVAPYQGQEDAVRPPMSIGPGERGALAALP